MLQNIVAAYEARALSFLEAEAATIRSLGEAIRANASKGHAHIAPATSRLGELIAGWDRVAQPIQLLRQELGDGHALSRDLARDIRSVSLELNNDHGLHQAAADITSILAAHFGEVSELRDTFERDALALEDIRTSAANSGPSEPPFSAKIGLLRTALTIDDHHLFWNDAVYPLAEIDRVRWGATRHSVNGIPTGTEYKIGFAIGARGGEIETRNKAVFQNVTSRLWRICGVRIAFEMIDGLKADKTLRVGGVSFADGGVVLIRERLFAKSEAKWFTWSDVRAWSEGGQFFLASRTEPAFKAKASYQDHDNTHALSLICEITLSKGVSRVSHAFGG